MRRTARLVTAVTMTTLAVAAAGCGGGSDAKTATAPTSPKATTAAPSPSPSASDSPSASESASADAIVPTGDFTKPGTELKFGDKAMVPFSYAKKTGVLGITAVGIKAGTKADPAKLKLGDKAKGFMPYYVTFKLTNESGTDFSYLSLTGTDGLLGDGSSAQSVILFGKFAPCAGEVATRDFITKGSTLTTCELELAGIGAKVVGANYSKYPSDDKGPDYGSEPITWK